MARPSIETSIPPVGTPLMDAAANDLSLEWRRFFEDLLERGGGAFDDTKRGAIQQSTLDSRINEVNERLDALSAAVNRRDDEALLGDLLARIDNLEGALGRINVSDKVQALADKIDELERARAAGPEDIQRLVNAVEGRLAGAQRDLEIQAQGVINQVTQAQARAEDQLRNSLRASIAQSAVADPANILASAGIQIDPNGGVVLDAVVINGTITGDGLPIPVASGGTGATNIASAQSNLQVPPTSRAINTGAGLQGGGNLGADRTLSIDFSAFDTGDITEGSNLYFTNARADARADARIAASSVTALSDVTDAGSGAIITSAERAKLGGIAAGAQVNTVTSVAGRTGDVTLAQADVSGLTAGDAPSFAGLTLTGNIASAETTTTFTNSAGSFLFRAFNDIFFRTGALSTSYKNRAVILDNGDFWLYDDAASPAAGVKWDASAKIFELVSGASLKFGTHAAITTETLSGFIEIIDAGGATRKLAVVS